MGQQMREPQWLSPEQKPYADRAESDFSAEYIVNTDPREQHMMVEGPTYGQKLRPMPEPPRQRRRSPLWFILVPLILLFLIMGAGAMFSTVTHREQGVGFGPPAKWQQAHPFKDSQVFPVSDTPIVVINDPTGNVTILAGTDGQVVVNNSGNGPFQGPGGNNAISPDKGNGTITINAAGPFGGGDLNITVPTNATIILNGGTGSVNVEGISGQLQVTTADGSITMKQVTLSGDSSLKTINGSITFEGTLDSQANVTANSDAGSIDIALPNNTAATVKATSATGSVNNAFRNASGSASLTAGSLSGSIDITKN